MRRTTTLIRAAALLTLSGIGMGFTGCSVIESKYGEERYRSLQGKHISEITRAADLAVYDGQLIIASRGMARGIAILDSASEVVTMFQSLDLQPESMVLDSTGNLFLVQEDLNEGRGAGVFDLNTGVYVPFTSSSDFLHQFFVSGEHVLAATSLWTSEGSSFRLAPVMPQTLTLGHTGSIPLLAPATSVAVHGNRVFLSFEGEKNLQFRERTSPFGIVDSIDLSPGHNNWEFINLVCLTVWKNKLFVLVQLPPDTTYVAVLDAATGVQTGSIATTLKQGKSAGVRNGVLYLYTKGLEGTVTENPTLDGGVEAIDLETETGLGLVMTEFDIGGNIESFVPFTDSSGYVLYQNGRTGWDHLSVRQVSYSRHALSRKAR